MSAYVGSLSSLCVRLHRSGQEEEVRFCKGDVNDCYRRKLEERGRKGKAWGLAMTETFSLSLGGRVCYISETIIL